jgi:hypothetical protein
MNITVDFYQIDEKEPAYEQHIVVTDGYRFRSGTWFDGYFIPDRDVPFEYSHWTETGER